MAYNYFQSESEDGYDYLFFAEATGRIYTVTFDSTIYSSFIDELPTLLDHGYGILFDFDQAIPKEKKQKMHDSKVGESICDILMDFLQQKPDSFLVYQCSNHKDGLFNGWMHNSPHNGIVKYGVTVKLSHEENEQFFGFISLMSNRNLQVAMKEFQAFSVNLSRNLNSE